MRQVRGFISARHRIFAITWITYAGFYLCRKNLSIVMPLLHSPDRMSSIQLANIVFGYSLFYAMGQFGFGLLSDSLGPRLIVGGGLLLVVGSNLLLGARGSFLWLLVFACLNGTGQATGWSGLVKIMASWFSPHNRGIVMAWWGTNYVFGGFLATVFATWAVAGHTILPGLGWRRGFIFPAVFLLVIALAFFLGVQETPEADRREDGQARRSTIRKDRSTWSDLIALLVNPALWTIGISYFFLEMCRYALMFWLPFYMVNQLRYGSTAAGYVSSLYELAGIPGAILAGYISDRFMQSRRAPVAAVMLWGLAGVMLFQPLFARNGVLGIGLAISLAGVLSYGPDTLLSGAGAQDVGEAKAAATAAGLMDGMGHVGSLFSPYLVVYVSGHYGWNCLFFVFSAAAMLAGTVLTPIWKLKPGQEDPSRVDEWTQLQPGRAESSL